MMKSSEIRKTFLEFFRRKQHEIVPSAPMVLKNDPTLMFTNAGMNQFKDIFLGNTVAKSPRAADTQKCLRVSGKHNDLEEVGHDTYHHTMFEMLGNWSFGDYFKKEAIAWAWELLTDELKIDKENLYITVFGGDEKDGTSKDMEAYDFWKAIVAEDKILFGSKKDNFWEMGETGPCGPCSEIHVDIRPAEEKAKIAGKDLVNMDHPEVIEIWNLVFIEFNRMADGSLKPLPAKHIDTGMGFERLCMVLQGVRSNYDTDVFQPMLQSIAKLSGIEYGKNNEADIAMRVIADHLRAVSFAIADGQLPSNTGAGYVIRRILRRAVRYGFTFLNLKEAFVHTLVPQLVAEMSETFTELKSQQGLIEKVIQEEEVSFLRTLSQGIKKFENYISEKADKVIDGKFAFELFDTYGFPIDLTQLMAREQDWTVDMEGFEKGLTEQKERSRQAAVVDTEDWIELNTDIQSTEFVGYTELSCSSKINKYRKVKTKKKEFYEVVLDKTPFYAESGGQVGDSGLLIDGDKKYEIIETKNDNNQSVHILPALPEHPENIFTAQVDIEKRKLTTNNHSATHLMHAALRMVLGDHVEQKGSLVNPERLRFDFSHFGKMTAEEIAEVEKIVNKKIRENVVSGVHQNVPIEEAKGMGAMALFGEKYGDFVRVIDFDPTYSVELCGGTHVPATGQIGMFKIISEGAIAAGVRRIEAITADAAEYYINDQLNTFAEVKACVKGAKDPVKAVTDLQDQIAKLQKEVDAFKKQQVQLIKADLLSSVEQVDGMNVIIRKVNLDAGGAKDLAFALKKELDKLVLTLGYANDGKAGLTVVIDENLCKEKDLNAGAIIREISKEIRGGGGGQAHFATAGGKNPDGIDNALSKAKELISK
ncbi:MAG: alanine--tRNA ligase [Hyphomicrobiales bacterium]